MPAAVSHSGRPFSVMAKPVGSRCNLRCSYCYYLPTPHLGSHRMSDETLERFIASYINASPSSQVSFVWHGGEPTLAGLDFFRRAVELQKQQLPKGWTCWNNLQTNGVLLDDDWCAFLAAERFDVGLSIDGTALIHDKYRPDALGGGSYQDAAAAVRRLQAHRVQPDLLCTVTSSAAAEPLAVYRSLRSFGTGWIQFIPIVSQHEAQVPTPGCVSGVEYGSFLCDIFDEWVLNDLGRLDVQLFAETSRILAGGEAGLCWMAPTCGRALVLEADGGVYSCDHYVRGEYLLGNIADMPLGELADSPVQLHFGEEKRASLPSKCLSCQWLRFCNGGCPKDRLPDEPSVGVNQLCDGLAKFFSHAIPALKFVAAQANSGVAPAEIMANLRAHAMTVWQGVGRNDPCVCGSTRKAKNCCWTKRP